MKTADPFGAEELSLAVGRLVWSGLDGGGLSHVEAILRAGKLGGLIAFREDLPSLLEARAWIAHARALAPHPILVGVDEEGGIVSQIDGVPIGHGAGRARGAPSPRSLGALDDQALTERVSRSVGRTLRATGFDVVFAPLLDVNVARENPVIGSRSFGATPEAVERHGLAAVRGFEAAGILPVVKHFPGHGAASADSHHTLPVIRAERAELERRDLRPFRRAAEAGAPLVMSAHLHVPALDPVFRPATCSPAILTGLLRGELGFRGAVVSDALEMAGFAETGGSGGVVAALLAGVDLFLVARGIGRAEKVHEEILAAAHASAEVRARVLAAVARVEGLVRNEPPTAGREELDPVVAEEAIHLEEAHRLGVRRLDEREPRTIRPARLLASNGIAWAFLRNEDLGGAFALPASAVRRYPPEGPSAEDLPDSGAVALILFTRGEKVASGDREACARLEAWRRGTAGRRVVAIAVADEAALDDVPSEWGRVAATGSHWSALHAAAYLLSNGG